jgi:hypothetical protein
MENLFVFLLSNWDGEREGSFFEGSMQILPESAFMKRTLAVFLQYAKDGNLRASSHMIFHMCNYIPFSRAGKKIIPI